MTIKPLGHQLLVEQLPERQPKNGIVVPDAHKEAMTRGDTKVYRVLAVGGKVKDVAQGDIAICYSATRGAVPYDDHRQLIHSEQIIAVVPAV